MQEEVFKFISATFGVSFAVAIAIIALALWLVFFITKKVTMFQMKHDTLAQTVECSERSIDSIKKDIAKHDAVAKTVENTQRDIDTMKKDVAKHDALAKSVENAERDIDTIKKDVAKHDTLTITIENVGKDIDTIKRDIAKHDALAKSVENAERYIDEIRRDIAYIKGNIDIFKNGGNPLMQSHSPISLTEEGKQVAAQIGAEQIIDKNWSKIRDDIQRSGANTAYDVQEYSMVTATVEPDRFFDKDSIIKVKDFAYQNGKPLHLYLGVIGLLIRDRYLEQVPMEGTAEAPTLQ